MSWNWSGWRVVSKLRAEQTSYSSYFGPYEILIHIMAIKTLLTLMKLQGFWTQKNWMLSSLPLPWMKTQGCSKSSQKNKVKEYWRHCVHQGELSNPSVDKMEVPHRSGSTSDVNEIELTQSLRWAGFFLNSFSCTHCFCLSLELKQ